MAHLHDDLTCEKNCGKCCQWMAAKKSDQRYNPEEAKNKLESFRIILTKDDILRASLQNRKPESLKMKN